MGRAALPVQTLIFVATLGTYRSIQITLFQTCPKILSQRIIPFGRMQNLLSPFRQMMKFQDRKNFGQMHAPKSTRQNFVEGPNGSLKSRALGLQHQQWRVNCTWGLRLVVFGASYIFTYFQLNTILYNNPFCVYKSQKHVIQFVKLLSRNQPKNSFLSSCPAKS